MAINNKRTCQGNAEGGAATPSLLPPGTLFRFFNMPGARCQRAWGPLKTFLKLKETRPERLLMASRSGPETGGSAGRLVHGLRGVKCNDINNLHRTGTKALSGVFPVYGKAQKVTN